MFQQFGFGGVKCPRCEHKNAGDSLYCAQCGITLGAPRSDAVLHQNRWIPGPAELAVFFGVRELSGLFAKPLQVPPATRAWVLQGGKATEVPPGEYQQGGFFSRLGRLMRDQQAEILITHSAALPLEFAFDDLASAEQLALCSRFTVAVRIDAVDAFARSFMTLPGTVSGEHLRELIGPSVREFAAGFLGAHSMREMAANGDLRPQLDERLQGALAGRLAEYGLAVAQVQTRLLRHDRPVTSDGRGGARGGSFWLVGEAVQAGAEHSIPLDQLYDGEQWQQLESDEQQGRLRYRRAQVRQGGPGRRAEPAQDDARRQQALRAREIELYGRVIDAGTRKQAIERGAGEVLAELEHGLAEKSLVRGDQAAQWAHLRQLAQIRMRTELEMAQQDQAEARQLSRQRFAHQLLQQQIENKIAQALGIEDETRKRAELARLEQGRQAGAERALAIDAEQHEGARQSLVLAHAAQRREAERVQEWEDQLMLDSRRELLRADQLKDVNAQAQAEELAQQAGALRRSGAQLDAIAQHEKLLRTIEADGIHVRQAQQIELDAQERLHALRRQEQEAHWQQELRRLEHAREEKFAQHAHAADLARIEQARFEALGAMSDSAKVALAAGPNAQALADVMKTQVHAGMSPQQLAALSGVVGAANSVTPAEAERLAQQRARDERGLRDADAGHERRHQLDLLALQNDVNKAALASHARAQPGGGEMVNARRCPAGHAVGAGARFCPECGAAL